MNEVILIFAIADRRTGAGEVAAVWAPDGDAAAATYKYKSVSAVLADGWSLRSVAPVEKGAVAAFVRVVRSQAADAWGT